MTYQAAWQPEQLATMRQHAHREGLTAYAMLFEAAERGEFDLFVLMETRDRLPLREMVREDRPALVLIHDDLAPAQEPWRWSCTRRVMRWATAAGIFSGLNGPAQYQAIIDGVRQFRRVVLILTDVHNHLEWQEAAGRVPNMTITVPRWVAEAGAT